MARMTREEKQAAAAKEAQTKKVNEIRQRFAKARALRTYDDRLAWETLDDKGAQALYELVHRYNSCADDLRKRTERLVEEMQRALHKMEANEADVFSYSNPIATSGSDIEALHTTRKVLTESIRTLAWATGFWVPQIASMRQRERHRLLCGIDVVQSGGGYGVRMLDGETATWLAADGTLQADGVTYETEELAWLAAGALVGDYSW